MYDRSRADAVVPNLAFPLIETVEPWVQNILVCLPTPKNQQKYQPSVLFTQGLLLDTLALSIPNSAFVAFASGNWSLGISACVLSLYLLAKTIMSDGEVMTDDPRLMPSQNTEEHAVLEYKYCIVVV
jgi:hypothetical protein